MMKVIIFRIDLEKRGSVRIFTVYTENFKDPNQLDLFAGIFNYKENESATTN
jgi:hypothetical protein